MASEGQRRRARSKQSERDLGKFLLRLDGPDPVMSGITSSTGRVGHITDLQFDVLSRTYAAENKKAKVCVRVLNWWDQIVGIAAKHHKEPLLRIVPTNGGRHQEMHIITAERHAELLESERKYLDLEFC